ncbi:hypothetical protein ACTOV4_07105 [Brucella sp. C7-11G]|uniref:hypothetical protein n=1 Tax=Brucella pituitosa TaxID=571256 RepID=UPI003F4ABAC4
MNKSVIEFVILFFVVAVLLPTIIGNRNNHAWTTWIYDYQTLIAGTLAIGAAVFTIRQMQATDAAQAKQHRELIELQLFQQQVAIQQAGDLIRALFITSTPDLVFLKDTISQRGASAEDVFPCADEAADAIRNIQSFLNSPAVARVEPLLGGDVVLRLLRARNAADRLTDFMQVCTLHDPDEASDQELLKFVEFLEIRYLDTLKQVSLLLSVLDNLKEEIKQLKSRFGVPQIMKNTASISAKR